MKLKHFTSFLFSAILVACMKASSADDKPGAKEKADEIKCEIIPCWSIEFQPMACGVTDVIHSISLHKQVSKSNCKEEDSWKSNSTAIFVNQGCRADFNVCKRIKAVDRPRCKKVRCQSWRYRRHKCTVNFTIDTIDLVKQVSAVKCVEHKNFHADGDRIVVDIGCRAKFNVCKCSIGCKYFTCQSYGFADKTCDTEVNIHTLTVKNKISVSACKPDVSFFKDHKAIKVIKGCRAVFKVCYKEC